MKAQTIVIIALLAIIMLLLFRNCGLSKKSKELNNLYTALNDTLVTVRNKNGNLVSKIIVLESTNMNMFFSIQSKEADIIKLQELVKENKGRIKNGGSVTYIAGETRFDTTVMNTTDTLFINNGITTDIIIKRGFEIKNKWIDLVGFIGDSTTIDLTMTNEYSVVIGKEKKKPFVEITNLNPYSSTTALRNYQVKLPKPKRFGLGISAGVGLGYNGKFVFTPYVGVGLNFNLITF